VVSGVLRRAAERPVYVCAGQVALSPDAAQKAGLRAAFVTPTVEALCRAGSDITWLTAGRSGAGLA
jgi:glycerate kinase